jgi:hypothetical protein
MDKLRLDVGVATISGIFLETSTAEMDKYKQSTSRKPLRLEMEVNEYDLLTFLAFGCVLFACLRAQKCTYEFLQR